MEKNLKMNLYISESLFVCLKLTQHCKSPTFQLFYKAIFYLIA